MTARESDTATSAAPPAAPPEATAPVRTPAAAASKPASGQPATTPPTGHAAAVAGSGVGEVVSASGAGLIRVVVADPSPLQRSGLRMALAAAADLTIVAEAGDGAEAADLARRLLPDVLVMDLRMPRLDGLAATRAVVAGRLPVRVLILTAADRDEHVLAAISAGAVGFLPKDVPAAELVAAIRTVGSGGAIVAPAILDRLLVRLADALPDPAATAAAPGLDKLTDREREVLVHVARGHTNAEIARALTVSETTIKTHVGHLLTKLGLRDRVQAVVLAYESGLVRPGS